MNAKKAMMIKKAKGWNLTVTVSNNKSSSSSDRSSSSGGEDGLNEPLPPQKVGGSHF